jgi:hypothetical protein
VVVEVDPSTATPTPIAAQVVPDAHTPPVGSTWTHLHMELNISTQGGTLLVQVGTNTADTFKLTPTPGTVLGARSLVVGLAAKGQMGDFSARMDNITYIGK